MSLWTTRGTQKKKTAAKPVPPNGAAGLNGRRGSDADSSEARSRQILVAMVGFRDGDFSRRLPTDWADTDGQIAAAFNQAIAHEARIEAEVTRLSATVGKEGRLKQRMSLPGSVGGWAKTVCTNGEDAEVEFREGGFDQVLTDISLPKMSGVDLARRVLAQSPQTWVIFSTGYEMGNRLSHLGPHVRMLLKPFEFDELHLLMDEVRADLQITG